MSSLSRSFSRALVASGAALALGSISLLGASAVHADEAGDRTFEVNSGQIVIQLGEEFAGYSVEVTAPVPDGKGNVIVESDDVKPDAADGYYAQVTNLAGPVAVQLVNNSAGPTNDAVPNEDAPELEANAAIYRGTTVVYAYEDGEFMLQGDAPTSPAPDSADLQYLVAVNTYTFTPTSFEKGKSFTIKFRDIVSLTDGKRVGEQEPRDVDFYGYSAPSFISSGSIVNGEIDFVVPAEFTNDAHDIVAFDEFGRANLAVSLAGGTTAPVDPARPALANTGAGDQTGAIALGAGVLALGVMAVAGGLVLRRRTAE